MTRSLHLATALAFFALLAGSANAQTDSKAATPSPAAHAAAPSAASGAPSSGSASSKKLPPIYDSYTLGKREIDWKKQVCVQSNRRLFVNFGTNDCAACRVVSQAMNDPKFQGHFTRQFVPAYVDVSPGSPNLELLKDWRIDPRKGLPAIVILDEKGNFAEATQDGEMAREAAKGVEAVQLWIIKRFYADQ